MLWQVNRALKPDAPFIAAMLGGSTLYELRTSLQQAEQERLGGIAPHISPMAGARRAGSCARPRAPATHPVLNLRPRGSADVRDLGALLTTAGFTLTTVDVDHVVIRYPNAFALLDDLRAMGESNAIMRR